MDSELVFTPAALLDLLLQIDELAGKDINISEALDGQYQLQIGNNIYIINDESSVEVEAPAETVEDVAQANIDAYNELEDTGILETSIEPVEAGILGEIGKSLWVGGLVRLAAKSAKNFLKN